MDNQASPVRGLPNKLRQNHKYASITEDRESRAKVCVRGTGLALRFFGNLSSYQTEHTLENCPR